MSKRQQGLPAPVRHGRCGGHGVKTWHVVRGHAHQIGVVLVEPGLIEKMVKLCRNVIKESNFIFTPEFLQPHLQAGRWPASWARTEVASC